MSLKRTAKAADPDIDRPLVDLAAVLAQPGDELISGEQPVGILDEVPEQTKLVVREWDDPAAVAHLVRREIERDFAVGELSRRTADRLSGAVLPQPVDDFITGQGADKIVVGSSPQCSAPQLAVVVVEIRVIWLLAVEAASRRRLRYAGRVANPTNA